MRNGASGRALLFGMGAIALLLVVGIFQLHSIEKRLVVQFEFGGADNHYGLVITLSEDAPPIGYTMKPVERNVWYYSEIRPRR